MARKDRAADGRQGKRKRLTWRKVGYVLVVAALVWFGISALFAFRGVSYLSDATFLIATFPALSIILGLIALGGSIFLLRRRRTLLRGGLTTLSALAVLSLLANSIGFAATSEEPVASEDVDVASILEEYPDTFLAGAAKGDITPAEHLMPMPLLSVLKFDEVNDPVYARVLAMSDGDQQSLFIMLDMTLVPRPEETAALLAEATGIPAEHIFIAATHTHGTTPISLMEYANPVDRMKIDEWYEDIQTTLLSTVREAQSSMVPATVGYGTGESNVNVNRDVLEGDTAVLGSNFDRPSDKTVRLIRFEDMEGDPIALIVNYAVHSVVLNGMLNGVRTPWSSDLSGRTSQKVESEMEGAVVLWSSGAAGDQNPRLTTQYGGPDVGGTKGNLGKAGFNVLEYLSEQHARDILAANETFDADTTDVSLYADERTAEVPSRTAGDPPVPYTLRLFMIGDIAFMGLSAEIVTSIGAEITATSPYEDTVLVSHANGYQGYVADDWEYEHDAFEVGPTVQGAAQKQFVEDFRNMFADAPAPQ